MTTTTTLNMRLARCATAISLLLALAPVSAFAPTLSSAPRVGRDAPCPARTSRTVAAAASEDARERGDGADGDGDGDGDADGDDGFDAGFRERLAREGGATGVRVKAARRDADATARAARRRAAAAARGAAGAAGDGARDLVADVGLLSKTGWGATLLSLGAVVLLAVAAQLTAPPPSSFADLSTQEQLERLSAEPEPEVTFGRAGFKI